MSKETYRILIPSEYQALLDAIEKERLRICIETLMNTGMRYTELEYFSGHLKIFDAKNNALKLPVEATKTKRERVIHLTPAFSKRLYQYLREHKALEVPSRRVMDTNLKRWWINSIVDTGSITKAEWVINNTWHPSTKTFRKSWESWLLASGYQSMPVALSQGHSELISYGHYANLDPRLKSEMEAVRKLTEGWGT